MPSKEALRQQFLARRKTLSAAEVEGASQKVREQLMVFLTGLQSASKKKIHKIGLYSPIQNEIDLVPCLPALQREKKNVFFPKVSSFGLEYFPVAESGSLKPGRFGIQEPQGTDPGVGALDVYFVPGIAFSKNFYRLGYGKGYFDRYFGGLKKTGKTSFLVVGVGHHFQLIEELPTSENDFLCDVLITESGILRR